MMHRRHEKTKEVHITRKTYVFTGSSAESQKRDISMRSIEVDKHFPQTNSRLEEAIGEDERQK